MKTTLIALVTCLLITVALSPGAWAQTPQTIRVEALIDGRSQLLLSANTAQWFHLDFAAPGLHNGLNLPTVINGIQWFPVWPDPNTENRWCSCFSNIFVGVNPPLLQLEMSISLRVIQGRSRVSIVQLPAAHNNFTLVIELDDDAPAGSDWYIVDIDFAPRVQANAGPDQTVREGASVQLDGATSIGPGLTFFWEQLPGGPGAPLDDPTSPTPTFTAPPLPGGFGSQTLTFQLTVTSSGQSSTDPVAITVLNVNHPPEAEAMGPAAVSEGSPVILNGSTSFDPDGDPIVTFLWEQTGGQPVTLTDANTATPSFTAPMLGGGAGGPEPLTFRLTVSDGVSDGALSGTDDVTVMVEQVNHAPTANAGPDQTKDEGGLVALDGGASNDPDNDLLVTFTWTQISGLPVVLSDVHATAPTFTAPAVGPGGETLVFRLVVSDGALESVPDGDLSDVTITVRNLNDPPSCAAAQASPALLWPPNHKLVAVAVDGVSDPDRDPVTITVTSVTQDEPVDGLGDGDTSPDAVIGSGSLLLRAERSGIGNGRVYQVNFTAVDGQSGSCSGTVTVGVPHSVKGGASAVDDGPLYDSTLP